MEIKLKEKRAGKKTSSADKFIWNDRKICLAS